jgi:hypothetical protein
MRMHNAHRMAKISRGPSDLLLESFFQKASLRKRFSIRESLTEGFAFLPHDTFNTLAPQIVFTCYMWMISIYIVASQAGMSHQHLSQIMQYQCLHCSLEGFIVFYLLKAALTSALFF